MYGSFFSRVTPTPTGTDPYLVAYSREVCALLELDPAECERPEFPLFFSGQSTLPGADYYAQCYGGHQVRDLAARDGRGGVPQGWLTLHRSPPLQFGQWAGQLGDGRAITMGEVVNGKGERWELQLKGAGKTPYSRRADGRAVMRSSIREARAHRC